MGHAGYKFDLSDILSMKKNDYKKRFSGNQLSAGWIPETALVKNAILSFYNMNKIHVLDEYMHKINSYNWSENEKIFLINFINSLKNM